jgi:threonine dehydratase
VSLAPATFSIPSPAPVTQLGADIADLSQALMPLMTEHGINLQFSAPTAEGVVIADASRNPTGAYKVRGALAGALAARNAGQTYSRVRIFVPVGGGGLAGGIASVVKNTWPAQLPTPEIIGVIDESSPASLLGTYFGRPVRAVPDTIADGTRVALVGNTFVSLAPLLDRILLVPHEDIVDTMRTHFKDTGERLEASGALALAGEAFARRLNLLDNRETTLSFALISGRNVDEEVFQNTLHQTSPPSASPNVRCAYDVSIPETPGELRVFLEIVKDYNITGLTYKQSSGSTNGTLRVEFDAAQGNVAGLERKVRNFFPGSVKLRTGEPALITVGEPVASRYTDELVTLEDTPGSFLRYIEELGEGLNLWGFSFIENQLSPAHAPKLLSVGIAVT